MKITNITIGARGVNAIHGTVLIPPGKTVDVELSDAEKKVAEGTGWFKFGAKATKEEASTAKEEAAAVEKTAAERTAAEKAAKS